MIRKIFFFAVVIIFTFTNADAFDFQQSHSANNREISPAGKVKELGDLCWDLKEKSTDRAIELGKKGIELADSLNMPGEAARICNYLGVIYIYYKFNSKLAVDILYKALERAETSKDSVQLGYANNNLGDLYYLSGNYSLASEYGENSVKIFTNIKNEQGIAYGCINLGLVKVYKKEYDVALKYFGRAIAYSKLNGPPNLLSAGYLETAKVYKLMSDYDKAIRYFEQSITITKLTGNKVYMAACIGGLGDIYYEEGKYAKAIGKYDEALKLNIERNNKFGIASIHASKALVYSKTGDRKKAESEIGLSVKMSGEMGFASQILEANKINLQIYFNLGDFESAEKQMNKYLAVSDSLYSQLQFETFAELQSKFQLQEKLNRSNNDLRIRRDRELFLLIIIILLVIIVFAFYFRFRSKKIMSEKLQSLNDSKDKLFSIISHDLKNPFMTLMGYIDLLKNEGVNAVNKNEILNDMSVTTQNTFKLLENLLNLSSSRTGKIVFNPERINLKSLCGKVVNSLSTQIKLKKIKLNLELNDATLFADEQMMEIILRNLISNAIKFSFPGGEIGISSVSQKDNISITVLDNGTGMENELKEKLFSTDFIKSIRGTANEKGTGLGLGLCNEFVKKHNGKIFVESFPGKGSQFTVVIPQTENSGMAD